MSYVFPNRIDLADPYPAIHDPVFHHHSIEVHMPEKFDFTRPCVTRNGSIPERISVVFGFQEDRWAGDVDGTTSVWDRFGRHVYGERGCDLFYTTVVNAETKPQVGDIVTIRAVIENLYGDAYFASIEKSGGRRGCYLSDGDIVSFVRPEPKPLTVGDSVKFNSKGRPGTILAIEDDIAFVKWESGQPCSAATIFLDRVA